jgi:hypothetical protein
MKPVFGMKPVTGDPENRPSVTAGDSIYYHHPDTGVAHHGVVAASGKHGMLVDADGGGEHQVRWDKFIAHRKRTERKMTIVDRGEDGQIMEDEAGKRFFVHGSLEDYEQEQSEPLEKSIPAEVEPSLLQKAQVLSELASAGFEPMMDYVKDTFGEQFVYRQPAATPEPVDLSGVIQAVDRLRQDQAAQFQGLCAAIAMMADKIGDTASIQQALIVALSEARKPQDVSITLPDGLMQKSEPANLQVDVHVPAPIVNVAAAESPSVHVNVPAQAAPVVQVQMPEHQQMSIVAMPKRKTEASVERDRDGNILRSSNIEQDL